MQERLALALRLIHSPGSGVMMEEMTKCMQH